MNFHRVASWLPSRVAGLAALLSLSLAAPAAAQPRANPPPASGADTGGSDRDQQARAHFEEGRQAYEDGRYRDAWASFHEAYQLSGRPELLYNIGQTADRLGMDADAIKAFNLYLKRLPNAPNRRDVENRVRALREHQEQAAPETAQPAPMQPLQPTPTQLPAAGAPAEPEARLRDDAPQPPKPAREPRRGLYLRAALGLGLRSDSLSIDGTNDLGTSDTLDTNIFGFGFTLDIAAGYGVLPGFVVGGALMLDWTSSPTMTSDEFEGGEIELDHANLTSFGPFIDWYPLRKTLGLHIMGGLGVGVLSIQYRGTLREFSNTATGVSFFLAGGWEFRIAGAFALGVLVRLTGAALTDTNETHGLFSPSLLMSFTWF